MSYKSESIKRIIFVGIVVLTFSLFLFACIHEITAGDHITSEDVADVMAGTESADLSSQSIEENSDTESGVFSELYESGLGSENVSEFVSKDISESDGENSEEESSDSSAHEGFMVDADRDIIQGISLSSPYCFVYNATDNTILYEKNAYEKCYPASVTKLLTAAVALEYVPIDTPFLVGNEILFVGENSSMAFITKGLSFTLKDLLYALLLPSGNDAAYTIAVNTARYLYGNSLSDSEAVESFMKLCNEKLLELGAYNTHFSCPDGYHSDDHYTTACDMMLISLYATSFEEIYKACGTREYYCKSVEGEAFGWVNTNPLMKKYGQHYCELVTGLKTGSTTEAGKCLATLAEKDGKKLYIVVLGASNTEIRNTDTLAVIHRVFGVCD